MATSSKTPAEPDPAEVGKVENPGAGERWGTPPGPDVDKSFPTYDFSDPNAPAEAPPAEPTS